MASKAVPAEPAIRIAVVGPCASGKSTLIKALRAAGFEARHTAQEHSYVPAMWQRISKPDVLIYLDVSYEAARTRRPTLDGGPERLAVQHQRLAHARQHCHFYLDTSHLTPQQVQDYVFRFLERRNFRSHAPGRRLLAQTPE
jgi:hypothetical protein